MYLIRSLIVIKSGMRRSVEEPVTDKAQRVAKLKWQRAGHIARITDVRWVPSCLNGNSVRRLPTRWADMTDDIKRVAGAAGPKRNMTVVPMWNSLLKTYVVVDVNWLI
ncbi:jg13706 [Pararge aegeria aegeria]|uniref:Jg13706 protein n=1 Tax=Pararge aegeria aegeria TaxID=348720 RepID=A0A8S4RNF0_9NEOP|nr:jg13706 [Pararge aegeria aegeria]